MLRRVNQWYVDKSTSRHQYFIHVIDQKRYSVSQYDLVFYVFAYIPY